MDSNAIQIAVRTRPWHPEKEKPFVVQQHNQPFFLGDGTFARSPRKLATGGSLREVVEVMDHRQLDFDKPEPGSETKRGQPGAKRYKNRRYVFDHVFQMDTTQEEVFEKTAKPLLPGVLDGYNATVFAYGATGCGKTHTISGTAEDPGITVRIMRELFEMIDATKSEYDTYIELSMVEIYNELIRDLLNDDFPACPRGGLKLLENEKERVTLDRVTLKRPKSVDEVMELVLLGNQRRSTSFTESNSVSSRSHAVLSINVGRINPGHEVDLEQGLVKQCASSATLSIIDLAGSERASATRNMGERMKEGANINKSLLALSSCISALCLPPNRGMLKPHVPYRNSKLTRMLKFSLGGNCRTVMIVCISPSSKDIEDTHNTLVWADKAKNVSTKISKNTAGNHVSVQQYLITINEQNSRIKHLEEAILKLEGGNQGMSGWALKKKEGARADAQRALDHAQSELSNVLDQIREGATMRALWDTAEMRLSALKRKLEEVDSDSTLTPDEKARQKGYLKGLVQQTDQSYRHNTQVQSIIHKELNSATAIERLLKSSEDRIFGDALDAFELKGYKHGISTRRAELANTIAAAREKGYRESAQNQAEIISHAAALIFHLAGSLNQESTRLSSMGMEQLVPSIDRLAELGSQADMALREVLSKMPHASSQLLPPLPRSRASPPSEPSAASSSSFSLGVPPPRFNLGAPVRATAQPPKARASLAAFHANPAARRVLAAIPGSPSRNSLPPPSPRSSGAKRQHRVGHVKGRTPQKAFRWKDEAGEGTIDDKSVAPDAPSFSSPSENGSVIDASSLPTDAADEWDDVNSSEEELSPKTRANTAKNGGEALSIGTTATRPTGSIVLNSAAPVKAPRNSLIAPPIPAWKRNRMDLGKGSGIVTTTLDSVGETSTDSSSSETGPRRSGGLSPLGTLGLPPRLRREPLGDRHQVTSPSIPTIRTSSPTGVSGLGAPGSNLMRPTLASLSKMSLNDGSISKASPGAMGPPARRTSILTTSTHADNTMTSKSASTRHGPRQSIQKAHRRLSSLGPYSKSGGEARKRSRGSILPGADASLSLGTNGLPAPRSEGLPSFGAPKRIARPSILPTMSGNTSITSNTSSISGLPSISSGAERGSSLMPPPSNPFGSLGAARGPRPSMSMLSLPRVQQGVPGPSGLSSRASISNLRASPSAMLAGGPAGSGGVGAAGDLSARPAWR